MSNSSGGARGRAANVRAKAPPSASDADKLHGLSSPAEVTVGIREPSRISGVPAGEPGLGVTGFRIFAIRRTNVCVPWCSGRVDSSK